jgi:hypothetical protein
MTVTIPAGDVANAAIATQITQLATLITANPLSAAQFTELQQQAQWQLVQNLINATLAGSGEKGSNSPGVNASFLNPSTILSTCTVNT